ncbi:MAG: phosphoribosylanthranilate isomerase [Anaerolineaceae bacterium]|nr:phosphoribosylanthranilate isomerase [Anaerolineaceae bacterium]
MTKIKLCGLTRITDIQTANQLKPDYIGFVFAPKSKRYIKPECAAELKTILDPDIAAVGVFVNEKPEVIAALLNQNIIDLAQLHGTEDELYIQQLRLLTIKPLIKAFKIKNKADLETAQNSSADHILLDAGAGDGQTFDWDILKSFTRPYFLAGGLNPSNVDEAIKKLSPYAVDVSSGIETAGFKDAAKMKSFVDAVNITNAAPNKKPLNA